MSDGVSVRRRERCADGFRGAPYDPRLPRDRSRQDG